ncbi:MAG: Heme/copper-type cytochrome oxidase, subunit 3 [Verrucomicrobiota bacterium]|jgi:cytochrome c oxidase subunit 3
MDIPYTTQPRPDTGLYNAKLGIWLFLASEVMLFGGLFSAYILLRVGADPGTWPEGLLNIPIGTFNTAVLITSSVTVVLGWAALKMNNFAAYRKYQAVTVVCALGFLFIKCLIEYPEKFGHYEVWKKDGTRMTGHIEGNPWFLNETKLAKRNIETIKFTPDHHFYFAPKTAHAAPTSDKGAHPPAVDIKREDIKRLSAFVPAHSTYFAVYFTLTALHGLHVLGGALVIAYLWGPGARMWRTDPERYTNRVEVSGLFWHFVDLVWIFLFPVFYLL